MNRLERLVDLVAALLDSSRPLTRDQIHERVPGYAPDPTAFRRAFERDKETLREVGIPIVVEPLDPEHPGDGVGYRIDPEHYGLPDPGLEPDEVAALHLAVSAVRVEGTDAAAAIWKLGGTTEAAASPPAARLPGGEHLPALFAAVNERRTVGFGYLGGWRTVDPHHLAFRRGRWYLVGHDHDRDDERSFRLDRFTAAPEAGAAGSFERGASGPWAPVPPWLMGDEEPVIAEVAVDADHAGLALAETAGHAEVEPRPGGGVLLRLRVTSREAFRGWLMGLLDHAEVVGPADLRAEVVASLEAMAAGGPAGRRGPGAR